MGYPRGIEDQARRVSMQITKLKRFKAAKANTRMHLYKQLVLPIMEHSPIPTYVLSKSRLAMLQIIQNRALRQTYLISIKVYNRRNSQKSKIETNESENNPKGK